MNNGTNIEPQAANEKASYENGNSDHEDHTDLKANVADYKMDAIEAENSEHSMTVLEAVRAYPMACFWAFVMSFTIVSRLHSAPERPWLTHPFRSWNPTMYFS
jgi:SP family general alpha glucoside:H+ symporter-like MFS transporter